MNSAPVVRSGIELMELAGLEPANLRYVDTVELDARTLGCMPVELHRCRTPWKFGPCWTVQKALDDEGIDYEVVRGPSRPKNRKAVIDGTGQPLYPAIRFDDGRWYRDESKEMARTIRDHERPFGARTRLRSALSDV